MRRDSGSKQLIAELAVRGGTPVRATLLPYGHQQIEEEDVRAVTEVLRSNWITCGPKVQEFEQALAACVGAEHGVSFSSGTAALHAAAHAAGLQQGDEAITTPLTFCATANCVVYQGATPVFADVCADTLNIDPAEVERRITPHTRAIIAVDYAGHPAELEALLSLARRHGVALIEDACHALGAEYRDARVGSLADMTVFSFHPVKHITTGEGGMVTCNDADLARRLRQFRNHGIDSDARERQARGEFRYDMVELGYNYRLPDAACALGLSQLRRLDCNLLRRRQIAARYIEAFAPLPQILVPAVREGVNPAWHLFPVRLDVRRLAAGRAEIFAALRAENIGVNVHYVPVHLHSYYRERFGHRTGEYPVAEAAYESLLSLPMFHAMTDEDVEDVVTAVHKIVGAYSS